MGQINEQSYIILSVEVRNKVLTAATVFHRNRFCLDIGLFKLCDLFLNNSVKEEKISVLKKYGEFTTIGIVRPIYQFIHLGESASIFSGGEEFER